MLGGWSPCSLSFYKEEHSTSQELGAQRMSPGIRTQVFPQFPKTGYVGDFPGAWEP